MATETTDTLCAVCGEPAEPAMLAVCNNCGARYHLNPRNDIEAKDCGQVWIDEQFLALQFACNNCLGSDATAERVSPRTASVEAPRRRRYRRRA